MFRLPYRAVATIIVLTVLFAPRARAAQTVGLFVDDSTQAFTGYTLFAPTTYTSTYLINHRGQLVHEWPGTVTPGQSCYLLENGHLHRTGRVANMRFTSGGTGGKVQEFDWDGTLLWDYVYSTTLHHQHHDAIRLPNGNSLLIAWEYKTQAQALAAGRNSSFVASAGLWPDHLIEVHPTGATTGTIVWEWHAWDHLIQDFVATKPNYGVVGDHPELVDLNFISGPPTAADWMHANGVDYHAALDQIVISVHNFGEFWVIDHGTTAVEAAGHTGGRYGRGGDLLYRWGNPRAYRRGTTADQIFSGQHNAQWIRDGLPGAGNFLVFNNGTSRGYSSVDELVSPADANGFYPLVPGADYDPTGLLWSYVASPPSSLNANNTSGAQRLPNGNTLVSDGPHGTFFEVTSAGQTVWKYVNPVVSTGPLTQGDPIPTGGGGGQENSVFRCSRYAPDFAGLAGRDLTPMGTVEHQPTTAVEPGASTPRAIELERPAPDPFTTRAVVGFSLAEPQGARLDLYDIRGRLVRRIATGTWSAGRHAVTIEGSAFPAGVYFVRLEAQRGHALVRRLAHLR